DFWLLVKVITILSLLVFLVYPFSKLIFSSFLPQKGNNITLNNYLDFFKLKYYYITLRNSLSVAITATITATIIGVPLAYLMTRYNIIGKKIINILIIMSLMSPPFIGAYSWILLLGRNGVITRMFSSIGITTPPIYGWFGIILVFTLKFFPYVYLYVSGAMSSIDRSLE
ncbi:iron ABC transporter permease, partial [Cutibacterium acnes]